MSIWIRLAALNLAPPFLAVSPSYAAATRPGAAEVKRIAAFGDAAPEIKVLVARLVLAAIAAVVLAVLNAARLAKAPARRPVGLGFVAGLRLGGPLLALAGVAKGMLGWHVGMVAVGAVPSYVLLAPGVAEAFLILTSGLIASAAAVFSHAQVTAVQARGLAEAHLDRSSSAEPAR